MPAPTGIDCPGCGAANRAGRRFCAQCGAALPAVCAACGFANQPDEKFCGGCGTALAAAAAPTVAGAAPPRDDGERRPVTVLFADLTGFTELAQVLDPEDTHRLLGRYFETVDGVVRRCGGAIDKHIGDSVMAVFGAPVAHGDEAVRAVRAADEIRRAVPALGVELGRRLEVHIGIAAGEVIASGLGSEHHRAYTVIGHSVNLAARLLQLARPGETLLDETVHAGAARIARCEALDGVRLKGIDGTLRAWRLVELRGEDASAGLPPLIGRRVELAQITAALDNCRTHGAGLTVHVRGEAGIGKSRLVAELGRLAQARGFASHKVLVLDFGMAQGRGPIRDLVASVLGLPPGSDAAARETRLARSLLQHDWALRARPFLRDLLDLAQDPAERMLYEAMDAAARLRGRADALVRLLEAATCEAPVLVTVEDVHWADRGTLEELAALTRAVARLPAILALTSRIDGDPLDQAWRNSVQGSPLLTLDLGPLPEQDARELAGSLFAASSALTRKCIERAAGNPLFLEQLLRSADERDDRLPASLHSLVLARMDRLPEADRAALRAAAVIGQRFPLALARHLCGAPDYDCAGLVAHFLVRPEGDEYLFAHALIRDGVYASLTRVRRSELHRAAAAWYGERDPALRAEHLDRAEDPGAPQAYLEAAQASVAALKPERALELAERGSALARSDDDAYALHTLRGRLLREAGAGRPALAAFEAALPRCAVPEERCRALIGVASAHRLITSLDAAFAALAKAEPLATAPGMLRERTEIHYLRGNLEFARGNNAACRDEHTAALACATELADPEWEARALSGLADADYAEGRMRTALDRFRRCVAVAEAHGLARIVAPNRTMVGICLSQLNEFEAALAECASAQALAIRLGDRHAEMLAVETLGTVYASCGRREEAAPAHRRGIELAEAIGARRYLAFLLISAADTALALDPGADVRNEIERSLVLARETGFGFCGPMALSFKARLCDDPAEARRLRDEAEDWLARGCLAHNRFYHCRFGIEDGLARRDFALVRHCADGLERHTRAEPLPHADTLIARARALLALHARPADPAVRAQVARLEAAGRAIGWRWRMPDWAVTLLGTAN